MGNFRGAGVNASPEAQMAAFDRLPWEMRWALRVCPYDIDAQAALRDCRDNGTWMATERLRKALNGHMRKAIDSIWPVNHPMRDYKLADDFSLVDADDELVERIVSHGHESL